MNPNQPPWDINYISDNIIDLKMPYMPTKSIFDDSTHNITQPKIPSISVPLAMKYRPKTFKELVGQEGVSRTLSLALSSERIANGYLFSGLRGSGKTSSARIFAKCLQCEVGISPNPCGTCTNCVSALSGNHIDIVELDGASNRRIDDIREIIELTKYKPTLGRFKIFIIDEVHMLTREAFNSLLKTLEEPPSYVKFILATTDPLKVPSTIISRTQHFRFKKIPINAIKAHLKSILQKELVSSDEDGLDMIIRSGAGSLRDTLTLLEQAILFCQGDIKSYKLASMLGFIESSIFEKLFESLILKDTKSCMNFIKEVESHDVEMILDELSIFIKNKMLEEDARIPPLLGMRYANIISDSKNMLKLDCDDGFCLLLTILKMLEAQKIRDVKEVIKQVEPSVQKPISNDNSSGAMKQIPTPPQIKIPKSADKFDDLVNGIYERDYSIGDIFKHKIRFKELSGNILHLIFYTDESETQTLRNGYSGILSVIKNVYGSDTKLQVDKKNPNDMEKDSLKVQNLDSKKDSSLNTQNDTVLKNEVIKDVAIQNNETQNNADIQNLDSQNPANSNKYETSFNKDFSAAPKDDVIVKNNEMFQNLKTDTSLNIQNDVVGQNNNPVMLRAKSETSLESRQNFEESQNLDSKKESLLNTQNENWNLHSNKETFINDSSIPPHSSNSQGDGRVSSQILSRTYDSKNILQEENLDSQRDYSSLNQNDVVENNAIFQNLDSKIDSSHNIRNNIALQDTMIQYDMLVKNDTLAQNNIMAKHEVQYNDMANQHSQYMADVNSDFVPKDTREDRIDSTKSNIQEFANHLKAYNQKESWQMETWQESREELQKREMINQETQSENGILDTLSSNKELITDMKEQLGVRTIRVINIDDL